MPTRWHDENTRRQWREDVLLELGKSTCFGQEQLVMLSSCLKLGRLSEFQQLVILSSFISHIPIDKLIYQIYQLVGGFRQNCYHHILVKIYSFTWLVIKASISFFEIGAFPILVFTFNTQCPELNACSQRKEKGNNSNIYIIYAGNVSLKIFHM